MKLAPPPEDYSGLTRLRPGMVVELAQDGPCKVLRVTDCRALVQPLTRTTRQVEPLTGEPRTFQAAARPFGISPNSLCPILAP